MKLKSIQVALLFMVAACPAKSADVAKPQEIKALPVPDAPFFFVNDNRITYAYAPDATYPGATAATSRQTIAFTHFDVWEYGTNFLNLSVMKYGHGSPANPCVGTVGLPNACAGETEFYGVLRSTFGWNQLFNTKTFAVGPLNNISFEVGGDIKTENTFLAATNNVYVAGLQFSFDLPYRGYFNLSPLLYQQYSSHLAALQAGAGALPPSFAGIPDGNLNYRPSWAFEANYYMDLGFLPASVRYFAISGNAGFYGPSGLGAPSGSIPSYLDTATQIYSEPVRLTFDASKAIWGEKHSHFLDVWVAYRYWENKWGLNDHNPGNPICYNSNGTNNHTCTESTIYSGITMKF